eukprot:2367178-Rhodomonas_salina.1
MKHAKTEGKSRRWWIPRYAQAVTQVRFKHHLQPPRNHMPFLVARHPDPRPKTHSPSSHHDTGMFVFPDISAAHTSVLKYSSLMAVLHFSLPSSFSPSWDLFKAAPEQS